MEGTQAKKVTFTSQAYALLMKNLTLLFRNKCALFCQLLPLIVIILCGIIVLIMRADREQSKLPYIVYNTPEDACYDDGWKMMNPPRGWYVGDYIGTQDPSQCSNNATVLDSIPRMKNSSGCYPSYQFQDKGVDDMMVRIRQIQTDYDAAPYDGSKTLPESAVILENLNTIGMNKSITLKVLYSLFVMDEDPFKRCTTFVMQWWSNALINNEKAKSQLVRGIGGIPPAKIYDVMYDSILFFVYTPIVFSLSMPQWLYIVVDDKCNRVREMMKMLGMKMTPYWVLHIVYFFCIFLIQFILYCLLGVLFGVTFILDVNWGLLLGVFAGYGLCQVCIIPLLNSLFDDSAIASTVVTVAIGLSVVIGEFLGTTTATNGEWYCIYPPFAFVQALERMNSDLLIFKTVNYRSIYWPVFVSLYGWPIILLIIGLYCDMVLPRKYGTPESPLFFLKWLNRRRNDLGESKIKNPKSEDSDVQKEYKKFQKREWNSKSPLIINGLIKTFKQMGNTQIAVNQLCLEVGNETFGLLGQNGAGKTTTISMLTGLIEPNGGSATVCGYNIHNSMEDVHTVVGVCPQFDVLWPDLTTYEIILFYCRLKGHFLKSKSVAKHILEDVGLWSDKDPKPQNRRSSQLSGGMRRRLSIAIAMTGNPKVIFLDEPTTGLDVAIRRDVWDLILKIQRNRCIIITTHSMEEADVLCDRVGIMSDGDLIALGTCQRIRNHYAPGYYIKIASEERIEVTNFLKQLLGEDVEVQEERGILTAMIPIDKKRLSNIFSEVLEHKEELKIEDWEIQQKGLEDAFIEIIEADRSSKSLM
ncbi:hypothetical protein ENUP19_0013G0012 [Entamoeba nuttalli]|uniref:ABC transporter, putative n=2 Tax=Entamoeba nuttalli TaxID=412467 RepID=K2GTU5_ENTNP|nr:ABC transporter, putative [Entamoeba nuttalli P19]EKE38468.1 ABC transporter, putative [Entamoeba nuttalli P19]|eukprot:XP_008859198.1 ABC transporter, putative [Entamoeba nuttalli P19]